MTRFALRSLVLFSCLLLGGARSHGSVVVNDPELWTSGTAGWTNTTGDATLSNPGTGGAGPGEGYLRITFGELGMPSYEEDTIYTDQEGDVGDYRIFLELRFSFYAEDTAPLSAVLYFHSTMSDSIWEFAFGDDIIVGTWTDFAIMLDYDEGWAGPGDADDFEADLANIDWIGINIARNPDVGQQDYGLDNWEYYIPEPGTMSALAAAFLSLAVVFRKRVRGDRAAG